MNAEEKDNNMIPDIYKPKFVTYEMPPGINEIIDIIVPLENLGKINVSNDFVTSISE